MIRELLLWIQTAEGVLSFIGIIILIYVLITVIRLDIESKKRRAELVEKYSHNTRKARLEE